VHSGLHEGARLSATEQLAWVPGAHIQVEQAQLSSAHSTARAARVRYSTPVTEKRLSAAQKGTTERQGKCIRLRHKLIAVVSFKLVLGSRGLTPQTPIPRATC
jgi:hypothetical protein